MKGDNRVGSQSHFPGEEMAGGGGGDNGKATGERHREFGGGSHICPE